MSQTSKASCGDKSTNNQRPVEDWSLPCRSSLFTLQKKIPGTKHALHQDQEQVKLRD